MRMHRSIILGLGLFAATLGSAAADTRQDVRTEWLLARGQTAQAVSELESRLGQNPFDPVTLNNLAAAQAAHGDYFTAASLLRRAQRLAPEQPVIGRNLQAVEEWISHRADHSRIAPDAAAAQRLAVPPEPPPLWP